MKLPINWLKEYIQIPEDRTELMARLTSIGHMQDGPPKEIAGDIVYDLEIRQNRSDCLSILGLAREASAVLSTPLKDPTNNLPELPSIKDDTKVSIENKDLCYRFNTLTFTNIKIGNSPEWLSHKLAAYGIKSINNLVDITNFVMIELGQPLHAFNRNKVNNHQLIIRNAGQNEEITIVGGKKLNLISNDLVIADDEKILAGKEIVQRDADDVNREFIYGEFMV